MSTRNGITMSPVGNRRGAVFRVPLFGVAFVPVAQRKDGRGSNGSTHKYSRQIDNSVFYVFVISQMFADISQSR